MVVGRYAGVQVYRLPNSYLRWLITQDFPKDILETARRKLKDSDYNDLYLHVSRHAIDMFSKRFLDLWLSSGDHETIGLGSFIAILAQEAWEKGADLSKHRHQNDGVVKEWRGIQWVFGCNVNFPDYKDLITCMGSEKQESRLSS